MLRLPKFTYPGDNSLSKRKCRSMETNIGGNKSDFDMPRSTASSPLPDSLNDFERRFIQQSASSDRISCCNGATSTHCNDAISTHCNGVTSTHCNGAISTPCNGATSTNSSTIVNFPFDDSSSSDVLRLCGVSNNSESRYFSSFSSTHLLDLKFESTPIDNNIQQHTKDNKAIIRIELEEDTLKDSTWKRQRSFSLDFLKTLPLPLIGTKSPTSSLR